MRLDQPWRSAGYCAVDLETTGLDLSRDAIVSFGAVLIDGGRVIAGSSIYRLVGGPAKASPTAITVHGLRPADLADAPPWEDSVDLLLEALTGRVLVAHAAWVERAFLRRAFRLRRVPPPRVVVDTAALARAAGLAAVGAAAEPSLEALAGDLGLPAHAPHHALGDALTTAEVFLALTARLDAAAAQTVRSLASTSAAFGLRLATPHTDTLAVLGSRTGPVPGPGSAT
ncbi:MAG TPA: 3'-5' exonuclease [Streptosporangiaceae bacterium]|nr:3'-5' exonuclease [Streptosporangiaceae bacterium]